jgi:hypothetical protein
MKHNVALYNKLPKKITFICCKKNAPPTRQERDIANKCIFIAKIRSNDRIDPFQKGVKAGLAYDNSVFFA